MKSFALKCASWIWSVVNLCRRWLYGHGFIYFDHLNTRVISVGNIQAGGSGKTPVVAQIAREALARGLSVCILTRGYRGDWEHTGGVVWPGGSAETRLFWGDEPTLLHALVPEAYIGVGKNRVQQYAASLKKLRLSVPLALKFDLVLLDDGFQNFRIKKDLDIVLLTARKAGEILFREFPRAVRSADLVVLTKALGNLCRLCPASVELDFQMELLHASNVQGLPLYAVAGVADPEIFFCGLEKLGHSVGKRAARPDHWRYGADELGKIQTEAKQLGMQVATTGKDWVKWCFQGVFEKGEVLVFEPVPVFVKGYEHWQKILWDGL